MEINVAEYRIKEIPVDGVDGNTKKKFQVVNSRDKVFREFDFEPEALDALNSLERSFQVNKIKKESRSNEQQR